MEGKIARYPQPPPRGAFGESQIRGPGSKVPATREEKKLKDSKTLFDIGEEKKKGQHPKKAR